MNTTIIIPTLSLAMCSVLVSCGDDGSAPATVATTAASTASSTPDSKPDTTPDSQTPPVVDPGDGGNYRPEIDPAAFVDVIDNPYMPFTVGSTWVYEGESDGEVERVEITVLDETRTVMGITATVVRDSVYVDDELVEDTYDWFAQDRDGNVWYLGEAVEDFENGQVISTGGSWEAGVDGALPGIVMPAAPAAGAAFRQEYLAGEAEDMFEILATDAELTVPAGTFSAVVQTEDWNPLDPDVVEHKFYAAGVGKIREAKVVGGDGYVELVEYTIA